MAFVIHQSTYKNTTGDAVTWTVEIIDIDASEGQTINFRMERSPEIRYAGLPQDLKPGIYPTTFAFKMAIRSTATVYNGTTYGQNNGFITDLEEAAEGRYLVKCYKDGTPIFYGVILPDQCSWEDDASPYWLTVQAADGLYRLSTEDYISEVGQIEYITLTAESSFGSEEFSDVPLTDGLEGTEWVMIEHYSELRTHTDSNTTHSSRRTTYARYEQYSVESPGSGWVDQGGSLWAKELDYFNELVLIDDALTYHLTRDIDNTPMRKHSEYIRRAFALMPTKDLYSGGMYDVCMAWYETGMYDLEVDPFTQIRWSEQKSGIGKKWNAVIEEILRHFYCRLYYSDGRYHIEQISERVQESLTRFIYDKDGTLVDTDTVNLDISYSGLSIKTEAGGSYKYLAPLKKVQVKVALEGNNLLDNQEFSYEKQGSRYLGRIKKLEDDTHLKIVFDAVLQTQWGTVLTQLGALQFGSTFVRANIVIRVRITNIETGTTYHLQPTSQEDFDDSTWETDPLDAYFADEIKIAGVEFPIFVSFNAFRLNTLSDDLPGNVNDSFDVYFSVSATYTFISPVLGEFWTVHHPDEYEFLFTPASYNEINTVDPEGEIINSNVEKIYEVVNDVNNSLTIEMDAKFCDVGVGGERIEVLTRQAPEGWGISRAWSRNGVTADGKELCLLLAESIMSLRVVPRRIYSGGFLTTLMTVQNRILRDDKYYLPLAVSIDTDYDKISGEFVHIDSTTPPGGDIIQIPYEGEIIDVPIFGGDPTDPAVPLMFVTDELIEAEDVLTEVDIVNTFGQYVGVGETVTILNVETGWTENVTLTQAIEPADTVMYFAEHTFLEEFPSGSPILIQAEEGLNPLPTDEYRFSEYQYEASEHYAPTYAFPNPEGNTQAAIDKRIEIYRNGPRMHYRTSPSGTMEYGINYEDKKFTFPVPFSGETIFIKAR